MTKPKMDGHRRKNFEKCKTHFFVTVVQTHKDTFEDVDGWNKKYTRCWGYAETFDEAEKAVLENYTDIHEESYQWAVIEEHVMDVFAMTTGLFQWYHWNENKRAYERCKQPEWAERVCGWGIG